MDQDSVVSRIRLIQPTVQLHEEFLECAFEFGEGHRDGFATDSLSDAALQDREQFSAWVATRVSYADEGTELPPDRVHDTLSWIVDEREPTRILGSISLRHRLNDFLLAVGGHIGYGVRPSVRSPSGCRNGCAEAIPRAGEKPWPAAGRPHEGLRRAAWCVTPAGERLCSARRFVAPPAARRRGTAAPT